MAFIKIQNLEFDENGVVSRGTASIVDVSYVPGGRNHSRQSTRERLGKVISIAEDRKSGVFMSPTRGLVEYNAVTDGDEIKTGTSVKVLEAIDGNTLLVEELNSYII